MKKIFCLLISLFLLINIIACAGYKPIFGSGNLKFKIADHSIIGNKKLGNKIYSRLYNLSKSPKNTSEVKNIFIQINITKNKSVTTKNNAGKILAYRINLSTTVKVNDFLTDNQILDENFIVSSSYKVQDLHSETIKLENETVDNLISETYQNLLLKLSENIL